MYREVFVMLLLVLVNETETSEQIKCHTFKKFGTYNYICPPNTQNKINVEIRPGVYIKILCFEIKDFHDVSLPNLNFPSSVANVLFQDCPIPKNGFMNLLGHFNIIQFVELLFIWKYSNDSFQKEHFEKLDQLQDLGLYQNNLSYLQKDLFKHTSNLLNLNLNENNITKLHNDTFQSLNKLVTLFVAQNKISSLSRYAFRGLKRLKELDLGNNKLREVPEGVFDELDSLEMLFLSYNKLFVLGIHSFSALNVLRVIFLDGNMLTNVSRKCLENNGKLQTISLSWNTNLVFADDVLSLFSFLTTVSLAHAGITTIPEDLLRGSKNTFNIDLQSNRIALLPEGLFRELEFLHELYLNNNEITVLYPNQFQNLKDLEILDLSHNFLTVVEKRVLDNLKGLHELNLSFNRLKIISPGAFTNKPNLVLLYLNNNNFNAAENSLDGLEGLKNIKLINLAHNRISRFPYESIKLLMKNTNKEYTVRNVMWYHSIEPNTIEIYLGNNSISNVRFDYFTQEGAIGYQSRLVVNITHNPIFCDCKAADLVGYTHHRLSLDGNVILKYDSLTCAGPPAFRNVRLENLHEKLACTLNRNCTAKATCDCIYESTDRTVIVDCSGRNLTFIPDLLVDDVVNYYDFIKLNQLEVHLEDNLLLETPTEQNGYRNVTKLFLQRNRIGNIRWVPQSIEVLNLENNTIGKLDNAVLDMLNKTAIKKLILGNNPWKCDCSTNEFQRFLRGHIWQIHNPIDIVCSSAETPLINMDESLFCPARTGYNLVILSIILFCLITTITIILVYLIYEEDILIWLYSKHTFVWLIDRIDKSKKYDAFVSFAQQDEDFVMDHLVPALEEGDPSYKLCIHMRDWIPGEYITKQIANSVKDSRRTLIVLSNNFLRSMWGKMEFRTAHTAAMEEGRVRVILIIYGELDASSVGEDLKSYMRTNTYVEWGDPWFWAKLREALPKARHKQPKRRRRTESREQDIELQ